MAMPLVMWIAFQGPSSRVLSRNIILGGKLVLRVLRDWKEAMYSCIDERIKILQQLHINKRKKQVLKSMVHLDYLNKLHDNFVLVPADKANNNVIVVCKKYYLDVVIMELGPTNTHKK